MHLLACKERGCTGRKSNGRETGVRYRGDGKYLGEGEASWEIKGALRVNDRRTRESGTKRSRSKFKK